MADEKPPDRDIVALGNARVPPQTPRVLARNMQQELCGRLPPETVQALEAGRTPAEPPKAMRGAPSPIRHQEPIQQPLLLVQEISKETKTAESPDKKTSK